MLEKIRMFATGRNVLFALVVFLFALTAINVAATIFYHSTGGYGLLDLGGGANLFGDRGSYTPIGAYTLINHYGTVGIERYYRLLVADIFFPATLGLFAAMAILLGLSRAFPGRRWLELLALLPVAYTLSDWLENIGITIMLANYPHELFDVAIWTNHVRGMKSLLATMSLLLVVMLWGVALLRRMKRRSHHSL